MHGQHGGAVVSAVASSKMVLCLISGSGPEKPFCVEFICTLGALVSSRSCATYSTCMHTCDESKLTVPHHSLGYSTAPHSAPIKIMDGWLTNNIHIVNVLHVFYCVKWLLKTWGEKKSNFPRMHVTECVLWDSLPWHVF